MPRPIQLPEKPRPVFGVWDRYGQLVEPGVEGTQAGWTITPKYTFGRGPAYPTQESLTEHLASNLDRWLLRCDAAKREALTLKDVFEGRSFVRAQNVLHYYPEVHFWTLNGEVIKLQVTRWTNNQDICTGPMDQPFTVRKALASGRALRLEGGTSLEFSNKVELLTDTVPISVIEEIYPP